MTLHEIACEDVQLYHKLAIEAYLNLMLMNVICTVGMLSYTDISLYMYEKYMSKVIDHTQYYIHIWG